MNMPRLTVLIQYTLTGSADAFRTASAALVARVERDGHRGVLSYRFYVNSDGRTARAVVDYADAAAWIGHHDIAMPWPEMKAMHGVATLSEVTFLGDYAPEIAAWMEKSSLGPALKTGYSATAGFIR